MHVNFVTVSDENLASFRMRIEAPSELLLTSPGEDFITSISSEVDHDADINCFSKHFRPEAEQYAIENCSTTTLFDVCDDHFDRDLGPHYEYMIEHADIVTCNTEAMQERIYDVTGKLARICNDPITFPKGKFSYTLHPLILWFGHRANLSSVVPWVNKLTNLTIVSNVKIKDLPPNVKSVVWKPGLVEDNIRDFDVVILPKINSEWARTKSPNRAVDALWAGKFVVTDFEEVYGGNLSPYIYLGGIDKGIEFYKQNPERAKKMVSAGQKYVQENYSDEVVREQWIKALSSPEEE